MTAEAWESYLAAARELDTCRREAGSAAADQDRALLAARGELAAVRQKLAPQRRLLRALGVTDADLSPSTVEVSAVSANMAAGPEAALGVLRRARRVADAADSSLPADAVPARPTSWLTPLLLRNLLIYGSLAGVVLVVQVVLQVTTGPSLLVLVYGLMLSGGAFVLGWSAIATAFTGDSDGGLQRTPLLGLLLCLTPAVLTSMGAELIALLR